MVLYDVDPNELIEKAAVELAKMPELQPPEWSKFVKTGMHKERPPAREDWWHMRTASILRKLYKYGPIGVSKLRTYYGGRKNRGHKPDMFFRASGNILRKILQQLEKAELAEQKDAKGRKGRTISAKGKSFLDKIAAQIAKGNKKKSVKDVKEAKKEDVKEKSTEKKAEASPREEKTIEEKKPEPKTKDKNE